MLQNILNLNGVSSINKNEQQSIKGGIDPTIVPIDTTNPCGDTGGRLSNISSFLCNLYGGVYLGNNTCMICH